LLRAVGRRTALAEEIRQFFRYDSGERGLHARIYRGSKKEKIIRNPGKQERNYPGSWFESLARCFASVAA
jgi:hypothetical protein